MRDDSQVAARLPRAETTGADAPGASRLVRVRGGWAEPSVDLAALGWDHLLADGRPLAAVREDGLVLACNDAMQEVIGWPVEALVREGWTTRLFPDPDEQAVAQASLRYLAKGPPRRHSRTFVRADGQRRVLDLLSASFHLPDGAGAFLTVASDITDARTPIGSGRGYRELVEDAPDILSRIDAATGRILFLSRAVERITGHAPADFYAEADLHARLLVAEYRTAFARALAAAVAGEIQTVLVEYRHRDGTIVAVEHALHPVRDALGRTTSIEGVGRDVTAVRALERRLEQTVAELRARNEELASLDRLKSRLLANVSHELRTPLVTIKGYNEILLRGSLGPLTPRQRRALEIAGGSTDRLVELIEAMLDFARLEEGRLRLRCERLDARDIARDVADELAPRAAEKGLRLSVHLGEAPLPIDADRARLAQILRVLLSNAEKFSDPPGEISVRAEQHDDRVVIRVDDTGIGIPAEALPRIFDRFYQVDPSDTRRFGGAGLGLALARELCALHGGQILVESQEGRGSSFTVRLPRSGSVAPRAAGRAVILVGALPPRARALRDALEATGFTSLEAADAVEIARRARRHRPDAVVLDLAAGLPGALESLRADPETSGLPVIVLAALGARVRWLEAADLVLGPVEPRCVARVLRRFLASDDPPARVLLLDDDPAALDQLRFALEREGLDVHATTSALGALRAMERGTGFDLAVLDACLVRGELLDAWHGPAAAGRTGPMLAPLLLLTSGTPAPGEAWRPGGGDVTAAADGLLRKPVRLDEMLRKVRLQLASAGAHVASLLEGDEPLAAAREPGWRAAFGAESP